MFPLEPSDFPLYAVQEIVYRRNGRAVCGAMSSALAEDLVTRLNAQEAAASRAADARSATRPD